MPPWASDLEAASRKDSGDHAESGRSGALADRRSGTYRLGTGGQFDNFFLWDTAFTVIWARYLTEELPVTSSLDNLYRVQAEDGFICQGVLSVRRAHLGLPTSDRIRATAA